MAPAQVPKVGGCLDVSFEDVEEAVALQEPEHGGGLAAGHDEAVWSAGPFEVGRIAHEFWRGAEGGDGPGMSVVSTLQGKDAYGQWRVGVGHLGELVPEAGAAADFAKSSIICLSCGWIATMRVWTSCMPSFVMVGVLSTKATPAGDL